MLNEKSAAITQYLNENFPNCKIEQKHDFDRGAQTFKIYLPNHPLMLKVADEFLGDNDTAEILRLLKVFAVADVLISEKELGVMIYQKGTELFKLG